MSFTVDLLEGIAQYLAAASAGIYRSTGAYAANETAIAVAAMPADPDRVIMLSTYSVTDDPSLSDSVIGLQVRCRGSADPRDVQALADTVFDQLHGLAAAQLGAVRVVEALRQSGTPLGRDQNNRWEHSDNYYLTVHRPSPHRI